MSFTARLKHILFPPKLTMPGDAYNLWANSYDNQPGNLVLDLDELVFTGLLKEIKIKEKVIVDIGCGTGRYWQRIIEEQPARLIGYDVSAGMLEKLVEKFPGAETYKIKNERLPELSDKSCDIIISTLALAHIEFIEIALREWNRVLKHGAEIIITDYHPAALTKGAKRTFRHEGKTVAVKSYNFSIKKFRLLAKQLGWKELRFTERVIDDRVKKYYEDQDALSLFKKFRNVPILYGIHLKKEDDPA